MLTTTRHRLAVSLTVALILSTLCAGRLAAQPPGDLALQQVVAGLASPVAVRHAGDGSGRLFIVEQAGVIRIWDGAILLPTPFLDITALVDSSGFEQGLLGLAFHPDYAVNGFFYVNYTRDPGAGLDRTVVARYQVSADPNVADPASAVTLLEIEQDFGNHNGGDIHFGPDGYLYIGMGDGGSGGDPNNRAQDLGELLGKMLRIDVDGGGGAPDCGLVTNYTVPLNNPFRNGPGGNCDEIWSLGLRNPWRWSFDRLTGDLFMGDVGQSAVEEIDFEPWTSSGGMNWGWRCYEGSLPFNTSGCGPPANYDFPILEYSQGSGDCSVTGGYRYRGSVIAGLFEVYVYGDWCSGRIWFGTESSPGTWSASVWLDTSFAIGTFGEDERGELHLADHAGGTIQRFVSPSSIFFDGFESGDLSAWSNSQP